MKDHIRKASSWNDGGDSNPSDQLQNELAEMARKIVGEEFPEQAAIQVETTSSNDLRSYHVSSDKIAKKLGYRPRRTVEDAIRGLCQAFKAGKLPNSLDDSIYFNVKRMKEISLQ